MPALTPDERTQFVIALGVCRHCGGMKARNYCRSCDEFFTVCGCARVERHAAHRVYLWTAQGVVAIPNVDCVEPELDGARSAPSKA